MNQLDALHGDEKYEPPRYSNIQTAAVHFKYQTSTPKTSPMVLDIMGRINHHLVDNGDVEL